MRKGSDSPRPQFRTQSSSPTLPPSAIAPSQDLSSSRSVVGSSLRREVFPVNSLEVLGQIVDQSHRTKTRNPYDEEAEAKAALAHVSELAGLKEFATRAEAEFNPDEDHHWPDAKSINKEVVDFGRLHETILNCDLVLQAVESSLDKFERDLGIVSSEIENLQKRSLTISERLERRDSLEQLLAPSVDELSIPPATVLTLSEGPIDSEWKSALMVLRKRLSSLHQKGLDLESRPAESDLRPLLEDLKNITIERGRDYFVTQIKALRSPNSNSQHIQQHNLLAFREILSFMTQYQPKLVDELVQAYALTMRWYYVNGFVGYRHTLEKLTVWSVDRAEAVGIESTGQKSQKSRPSAGPRSPNSLSIGRRHTLLSRQNNSALPAYAAQEMKSPVHTETPFYAFTTAIADNASAEYAFLSAFLPPMTPLSALSRTFSTIFAPVFDIGLSFTKNLIGDTMDCIGILLCIRITQQQAFALQRQKCPVADGWINGTNMLLWPKFQNSLDAHIDSVKRMTEAVSSAPRATLSLTSNKSDSTINSIAPHLITQRYGQLVHGILTLTQIPFKTTGMHISAMTDDSTPLGSDSEPVGRSLDRLRSEVELFLYKIASTLGQGRSNRFLANNFSLVMTIIADTKGRLAHEQHQWFKDKLEEVGGI